MPHYLLTGAGFTRNWGGWLASEAFEYLLGCEEIDDHLRHKLWQSKTNGNGFEDTLADLQQTYNHNRDIAVGTQLQILVSALVGMFNVMAQSFMRRQFEINIDSKYSIHSFLERFDAIFTLNQDTLLEYHYLHTVVGRGRWSAARVPGIKLLNPGQQTGLPLDRIALMQPDEFNLDPRIQPYFKLHGSSNWMTGPTGERILIMGGNKAISIKQFSILTRYHTEFQRLMNVGGSRLMVIGYSFSDAHINKIIGEAVDINRLKLFIVDPQGVDVIDKSKPTPIRIPDPYMGKLAPHIIGASRRTLIDTFAADAVEFDKLSRFFA
jgi:SIR2-like domain